MSGHQFFSKPPQFITPAWVAEGIKRIESVSTDAEMAHSYEDMLHQVVLLAIAERRCVDPATIAKEALRTGDIEFARWCA